MKGVDLDHRKEGLFCVSWKVQPIQVAGTELGFLSMNPIQIIRKQSLFQFLLKSQEMLDKPAEVLQETWNWAHFLTTGQKNEKTWYMLQVNLSSVALAAVLMMYWRDMHPTLTAQGGDYQVEKKRLWKVLSPNNVYFK